MEILELAFLLAGILMAVFAMLLLYNFISVSISYKKKEIGILRAVGARGADVFKIFYCESAIIALVCYVLALIGCFVLCAVLNGIIMQSVSITLLVFGPLSWLVMLVIAVFTSALATFLPVRNYTKRKPIESIRAISQKKQAAQPDGCAAFLFRANRTKRSFFRPTNGAVT